MASRTDEGRQEVILNEDLTIYGPIFSSRKHT